MLADLESTPALTGATFIYIYLRRVEIDVLRGAFPIKHVSFWLGVLQSVLRDVKLPVGPWGSNRTLADLNPGG